MIATEIISQKQRERAKNRGDKLLFNLHQVLIYPNNTVTAPATILTIQTLRDMNANEVGTLLYANGASDNAVSIFVSNNITGDRIADGLSNEDLKELGFTTGVERHVIVIILQLILSRGMH